MNEEQLDKIERYVHEQMNPQERLQFEAELQTNTELAADMKVYRMVEEEMNGYDEEAVLRASLQSIGARYTNGNNTIAQKPAANVISVQSTFKRRNRWKGWAAAAAVIVVIASAGIWNFSKDKTNTPDIAATTKRKNNAPVNAPTDTASSVQPYDMPVINKADTAGKASTVTIRKKAPALPYTAVLFKQHFAPDTPPEDQPAILAAAFDLYAKKDYREASVVFENADPEFTTRGEQIDQELTKWYTDYYKGICYLKLNDTPKAIAALQRAATTTGDSLLQAKAQWYLALGYLKGGKPQQATAILKQITQNDSDTTYKAKAQSVLTQLEAIQKK